MSSLSNTLAYGRMGSSLNRVGLASSSAPQPIEDDQQVLIDTRPYVLRRLWHFPNSVPRQAAKAASATFWAQFG